MSSALRHNRKASDEDIIRLNSVGLPLRAIAEELGCHPTTITLRLDALGIPPADTRRAFMKVIYEQMTEKQKVWLQGKLGPKLSIHDFILNILVENFIADQP